MNKFAIATVVALTLSVTTVQAQSLPTEFEDLPLFLRREVTSIRTACSENAGPEQTSAPRWPMSGFHAFYLDQSQALLVDDRHVCGDFIKAGNCHTFGCDVRVYRRTATGWEKILDEPVSQLLLNIGGDDHDRFKLAVMLFTRKHLKMCGNSWTGDCVYSVTWNGGKWHWKKLGEGR